MEKLTFRNVGKMEFSYGGKLKQFVANRSTLKEWLKKVLSTEKYNKRILQYQEEKRNDRAYIWVHITDYPFPCVF